MQVVAEGDGARMSTMLVGPQDKVVRDDERCPGRPYIRAATKVSQESLAAFYELETAGELTKGAWGERVEMHWSGGVCS